MSQFELARITGIHPSDISKLESGRYPCHDSWRRRIVEALDWPADKADELFREE
jgi:hypothetical protein